MKLTIRQIDTTKPKDKAFKLSDGGGLYLLVNPSGSKYWRLKYRFAGKEKLLAIGVYPDISLAQARSRREEAKKLLLEGKDPGQERKLEKLSRQLEVESSFEVIAREWYTRRFDRWSVSYREEMMRTFEKDVFPFIGHRPIKDIKPLELLEVLSKLETRGATEKARKVRQRCGEVWKYAIVTGRAEYNPAPDLASALVVHEKEHYAFLMKDELPDFLRTLETYSGSILVKIAMKLTMLTGVRPGELRKAEWSEFDFEKQLWHIPKERMKMGRPHMVPLSNQVIDLLNQLRPITSIHSLLFPGRNDPKKPMSDMALTVLVRRIGYAGRVTGHGFRHTMSTILHEQGFNTAWIETQLAHVDKNSIRGTYNHAQYLEGRREMMQWYADYIDSLSK
ncbi:tyrosine-type recombinase/integrase [Edwardsiella ictaluri]|uniref:tyrosine-type recombinase/integrase n=1 Tax=Edwardsiella ictaluri TaxID=67780 RepID=UPI0009BD8407|nr:integrase arm-type DNA-binding domain-containing protein [Edwardsiella ictaluri]ARD39381.1 integrase [Edwardsiella ictaluri]QPW27805.1 tyrosine-type recombinase/integrase [Edwardsiella ictaluri]